MSDPIANLQSEIDGLSTAVHAMLAENTRLRASNAALVRVNEVYWREIQAWRKLNSANAEGAILHDQGLVTQEVIESAQKIWKDAEESSSATDHAREGTK